MQPPANECAERTVGAQERYNIVNALKNATRERAKSHKCRSLRELGHMRKRPRSRRGLLLSLHKYPSTNRRLRRGLLVPRVLRGIHVRELERALTADLQHGHALRPRIVVGVRGRRDEAAAS